MLANARIYELERLVSARVIGYYPKGFHYLARTAPTCHNEVNTGYMRTSLATCGLFQHRHLSRLWLRCLGLLSVGAYGLLVPCGRKARYHGNGNVSRSICPQS